MTRKMNLTLLRVELVRRGLTQVQLAETLRIPSTTLSGYLHGHHPAPEDLVERIEGLLHLAPGTLRAAKGGNR